MTNTGPSRVGMWTLAGAAASAPMACAEGGASPDAGASDASLDRGVEPGRDATSDTSMPVVDAGGDPADAGDPLARCTVITMGDLAGSGQPGLRWRLSGNVKPNLGQCVRVYEDFDFRFFGAAHRRSGALVDPPDTDAAPQDPGPG